MSDQNTGNQTPQSLAEQILDRIASDSDFRQQLLDNPTETLQQAGYKVNDEVQGYGMMGSMGSIGMSQTTAITCPSGSGAVGSGGGGGGSATTGIGCGEHGGGGGASATTAIGCGGGSKGGDSDPAWYPGPDPKGGK